MSAGPELSSVASALAELTARLTAIAESLVGTQDDDLALALFEVERSLRNAARLLERATRDLG